MILSLIHISYLTFCGIVETGNEACQRGLTAAGGTDKCHMLSFFDIKDYSIALQNVSFRYENAGRDALHQINLDIKEGEHVACLLYTSRAL